MICSRGHQLTSWEEAYQRPGGQAECRTCRRADSRDWARRNRERKTATRDAWVAANRDRWNAYMRAWRTKRKASPVPGLPGRNQKTVAPEAAKGNSFLADLKRVSSQEPRPGTGRDESRKTTAAGASRGRQ